MITATAVRERPILFSGPMVQALLDGRKTQTRRVVKPQAPEPQHGGWISHAEDVCGEGTWLWEERWESQNNSGRGSAFVGDPNGFRCPFGQPGDRLWVRETWNFMDWSSRAGKPLECVLVEYVADGERRELHPNNPGWNPLIHGNDRPSIYMPRWASRITLEITDVSVERVQDIKERDAQAEGVWQEPVSPGSPCLLWRGTPGGNLCSHAAGPLGAFRQLWDTTNGPRGFGWDANPWVWAVSFRALNPSEGEA